MVQLIPMVIVLALFAFWLWMFLDMTNNRRLPTNSTVLLSWPPSSKFEWMLALVVLNVFGAVFYYFYEYRNRY